MKKIVTHTLLLLALLLPFSAQALILENCDTKPHTISVIYAGENTIIELAPWERRFVTGLPIRLEMENQTVEPIRYNDEYCIWSGELSIQRRGRSNWR